MLTLPQLEDAVKPKEEVVITKDGTDRITAINLKIKDIDKQRDDLIKEKLN